MTVSTALPIDSAWAQGVKRPSAGAGASRSIILRAVVLPFCKLSKVHHGMRLRGASDDGAAIDSTVGGEGGFTVICNKPYAMNLERAPVWGAPAFPPKRRRAAAADPFGLGREAPPVFGPPDLLLVRRQVAAADASGAFALARVTPETEAAERDFEVVLSVDLNDGPLQSSCVMGSAESSNFVCHAFPGAEGARLPLPRMDARLAVTGSEAPTTALASATADIPPQTLIAFPGGGGRILVTADGNDSLTALDSVVRQQRTGDRLTISVTAKY
jgi:hypothetical protein